MRYDVVIVGAGPAGAVLAYLLARAGAEVLLLEKEASPSELSTPFLLRSMKSLKSGFTPSGHSLGMNAFLSLTFSALRSAWS
jgi:flavin-dependent dehydrogenase